MNRQLGCSSARTFRLASYSQDRLRSTVERNLLCLGEILRFNQQRGLLFFRLSSGLVPFASHTVCDWDWRRAFRGIFRELGGYIRCHGMRISMHPDQFTVINALDAGVVHRSVAELVYHVRVLDALELDDTHKVQIHAGGAYGDKQASLRRFARQYRRLPRAVRRRLAVENDDRLFTFRDCLWLHGETGIPVIFDNLHHAIHNDGTALEETLAPFAATWSGGHGLPMLDYSSQERGRRIGAHTESIDPADFERFLRRTEGYDFDVMCEIKDKETSALAALETARRLGRC